MTASFTKLSMYKPNYFLRYLVTTSITYHPFKGTYRFTVLYLRPSDLANLCLDYIITFWGSKCSSYFHVHLIKLEKLATPSC